MVKSIGGSHGPMIRNSASAFSRPSDFTSIWRITTPQVLYSSFPKWLTSFSGQRLFSVESGTLQRQLMGENWLSNDVDSELALGVVWRTKSEIARASYDGCKHNDSTDG